MNDCFSNINKGFLFVACCMLLALQSFAQSSFQRISLNQGWKFTKGDPANARGLSYDVRPEITDRNDNVIADSKPTLAVSVATQLRMEADRLNIQSDGSDLSFVTVSLRDSQGNLVPDGSNNISFSIQGPGEIVATDNGNPADLVSFASKSRAAFYGLALVIVRSKKGQRGVIRLHATSFGLKDAVIEIKAGM